MSLKISPFAPKKINKFSKIVGINVSSINCGLKKNNKADLVLIKFDSPSNIISFFTNDPLVIKSGALYLQVAALIGPVYPVFFITSS